MPDAGRYASPGARVASQSAPGPPGPTDPMAMLRSRAYLMLLVVAAILGVPFPRRLGLPGSRRYLQKELFTPLPHGLGYSATPAWSAAPDAGGRRSAGRPGDPVPAG